MIRRADALLAKISHTITYSIPVEIKNHAAPDSVARRVFDLAWPSVLEQSLITLVGLVDTYIVGHLGAEAIAGVGLGGQVLNVIAALFGAVGVGGTAVVARAIGANDQHEAETAAGQGMIVAAIIGFASSLVAVIFAEPIITSFGSEPGVVVRGAVWLRIAGSSFALVGLLLVGNAVLRGAGDTRTPLAVMIVVNIVNVAVAWILTRILHFGVVGTGIGFALGQISGGVIVIIALFRGRGRIRIALSNLRPELSRIQRVLNIGFPAGMEQILLQSALVYSAVLISGFGTAAYAAHQIALRISAMAYLPGWGFSVAATTLVGQGLGANRPDHARESTRTALHFALIVMTAMGIFLFAFAAPIVGLFTSDADVIREGAWAMRIAGLIQPLLAQSFIYGGALRGAGDTRVTMVVTMSSVWGLRIVAIYMLGHLLGLGLIGTWIAMGIDFLARGTLFALRFRTGKWAAVRV